MELTNNKNVLDRSDKNMKEIAFEVARQYLLSFTPYKKSQIALVLHDKGTTGIYYNFITLKIFSK